MSKMAASADVLFQLAKTRRTYYPLNKTLSIPAKRIHEIVNQATLHTPSSFNSQSTRTVILLNAEHDKLWDIVSSTLKPLVPNEKWQHTADRVAMFRSAAGTILFFEDQDVVSRMQEKFPSYTDKFPGWAGQSDAMQQYLTWTALELEGLGANLQHYNPLIDDEVRKTWDLLPSWKLNAQLVFGGKTGEAGEKTFEPLEQRVKIFGA